MIHFKDTSIEYTDDTFVVALGPREKLFQFEYVNLKFSTSRTII